MIGALLDEHALRWVADAMGAPVVAVEALAGGVASRVLRVRVEDSREAVLRQLVADPWRRHAEALLRRERDVHDLLADSPVPAPRTLALDVCGDRAGGDPSLLMTSLPGRVDAEAPDVHALASALLEIHGVRPPRERRPRVSQSWAHESKRRVPPWAADASVYEEAFVRLAGPEPGYEPTFLHRDFHPANVLWLGGTLTGVVDWVEASTGPVDLDVAHCASNLAGLLGVETALAFRRSYVDQGGVLDDDPEAAAYWQLLDLVAFLPTPEGRESGAPPSVHARLWADLGRGDLTLDLVRRRRQDLLTAILSC